MDIMFSELSGVEFNKIFHNILFIKLTNVIGNHSGYQFHDDLNIDTIEFNPSGECV